MPRRLAALSALFLAAACFPKSQLDDDDEDFDADTAVDGDEDDDTDRNGDTDSDSDSDTDTDTDTDVPDYTGEWTGTFEVTMTEAYLGTTDTCTGPFVVTVHGVGYPNTGGEGVCEWGDAFGFLTAASELSLGGELIEETGALDTPGVTFTAFETAMWTPADGSINAGGDRMTGSFAGEDVVLYSGFDVPVSFSGSFTVSR